MGKAKQKKVDKSLDMTFPASDPPASRRVTGTETPGRPSDRHAPVISKEEIEAAAGDAGRQGRREGPTRHQGASRDGHNDAGGLDGSAEDRDGAAEKSRGGRE
jgi:hypothetical protein